jgi:hypothetical protein
LLAFADSKQSCANFVGVHVEGCVAGCENDGQFRCEFLHAPKNREDRMLTAGESGTDVKCNFCTPSQAIESEDPANNIKH